MDLGGDEFTKQLVGSSVANGIFLLIYFVVKCCRDRLKHSHCKSCCCEFDADLATIRSKHSKRDDSRSLSSTNSVSKKQTKQHHEEV